MAVWEFQDKNGKVFEIDAPDENAAINAWKTNQPSEDQTWGEYGLGLAKAAGTGLAKSIPDMLGTAASGAVTMGQMDSPRAAAFGAHQPPPSWLPDWLAGKGRAKAEEWSKTHAAPTMPTAPNPQAITNKVGDAVGGWYEPQNFSERLAMAGGESAPMGLVSPAGSPGLANALARMAVFGAIPGMTGKAAGETSEAIAPGQKIDVPGMGEVPLSSAAEFAGSMWSPGSKVAAKRITPFTQADPTKTAASQLIREQTGRWPTVGQTFGNQAQINRELKAQPDINVRQAEDLTRAYTRRAGGGPGGETPQVTRGTGGWFDQRRNDIDSTFRNLSNTVFADPRVMGSGITNTQLYNDLANISQQAIVNHRPDLINDGLTLFKSVNPNWVPAVSRVGGGAPLAQEMLHDALFSGSPLGTGTGSTIPMGGSRPMSALHYQQLRDTLHHNANLSDPERANFFRNISDALDSGVENTLSAHGNQPLAMAWNHNRSQQRSLAVLENAAGRLAPGTETLSPDVMQQADIAVSGLRPYLRGTTPYSDLTNAAGKVFRPLEEKEVVKHPTLLGRAVNALPGGSFVTEKWPVASSALAGAAARYAGLGAEPAISAGILGAILGDTVNPFYTGKARTVGSNPVSQAYGRNQVLPLPSDQAGGRAGQALLRALMQQEQPPQNQ